MPSDAVTVMVKDVLWGADFEDEELELHAESAPSLPSAMTCDAVPERVTVGVERARVERITVIRPVL